MVMIGGLYLRMSTTKEGNSRQLSPNQLSTGFFGGVTDMRSIKHLLGMVDTRLKLLIARLRSTHDLLQDKYPLLPPLAIIVIVSFAVYYNALSNSFVSDDIYQIVK